MVFVPKKNHMEKPALLVELKWNRDAKTAIDQIKEKGYCESLKEYQENVLLVGSNYDKKSKKYSCRIE